MADSVRIEGLAEIGKRLRALPKELGSKGGGPLRYALFKSAKVILTEAKRRVPVDTGALRDNIITKRERNPKSHGVTERYGIGMRGGTRQYANNRRNRGTRAGQTYRTAGKVFYGRFIELGTSKMPARPFLRPALAAKQEESVQTFRDEFLKAVERAERKLSRMK